MFKIGIYVLFFVILIFIFFGLILVKIVCSNEEVKEVDIMIFSLEFIDVMYEVISFNVFNFDEFYIVMSEKYFCMGVGDK